MYIQSKKSQVLYIASIMIGVIFFEFQVTQCIAHAKIINPPKTIAHYKTLTRTHVPKTSVKNDVLCCGLGIICWAFACYTAVYTKDQYYLYQSLSKQEFDKPENYRDSLLTNLSSKIFSNKKNSKESNVVYQQLMTKKQNDMLDSCAKGLMLGCGSAVFAYVGSRLLVKGLHLKSLISLGK